MWNVELYIFPVDWCKKHENYKLKDDWISYINGNTPLSKVIERYDEEGFQVSVDTPFNGQALDAFAQIENCKEGGQVI